MASRAFVTFCISWVFFHGRGVDTSLEDIDLRLPDGTSRALRTVQAVQAEYLIFRSDGVWQPPAGGKSCKRRHIPIGIPTGGALLAALLSRGKRSSDSLYRVIRGSTRTALQVHGHQAVSAVAWQIGNRQAQVRRQAVSAVAW